MPKTIAARRLPRRPENPTTLKEFQAWMRAAETSHLADLQIIDDPTLPRSIVLAKLIERLSPFLPEELHVTRQGKSQDVRFVFEKGQAEPPTLEGGLASPEHNPPAPW